MSDDLKSRLRKLEGGDKYGSTVWYRNPDGPEAADRIEKLEAALLEATNYTARLAVALSEAHYSDGPTFEPFDDLIGLLTQIDNMTCGLARKDRIEKLEAALRSIAANTCCDSCREAALVARKALEGKDE